MRKLLLLVLLILPIFLIANEEYDFRNTKWGMTKEEVKLNEVDREIKEENEKGILYLDTLINIPCGVYYFFENDKLINTIYIFENKHTNKNLCIEDYKNIKELMIEKYGKPNNKWDGKEFEEVNWSDDLYKNKPDDWGFAVSIGHVSWKSSWILDRTKIMLKLFGDNYKITLAIGYYSKELYHNIPEEK